MYCWRRQSCRTSSKLLTAEFEHKITIIEMRRETSMYLADSRIFVSSTVISDIHVLEVAAVDQADLLVSLTGEDETNLVVCQLGKIHFNVATTVARVNNPKNMDTFRRLGVDKIVCGTKLLADIIDQEINYAGMRLAFDIPQSNMGILEFYLDPQSDAVGKTLLEYTFPGQAKVVLVTRPDGKVELPTGDLRMQRGDRMLMVADKKHYEKIWDRLVDQEATFT